jgi:hypothetical protein
MLMLMLKRFGKEEKKGLERGRERREKSEIQNVDLGSSADRHEHHSVYLSPLQPLCKLPHLLASQPSLIE